MLLGQPRDGSKRVRHDAHAEPLLPEHQHLRFGLDDGLGGQQALAQFGDLLARAAAGPRAGAQVPEGGEQGERGGACGQGEEQHGSRGVCGGQAGPVEDGDDGDRNSERADEPQPAHLATQPTMIALSACPPHRRPSIGPTAKRAYARREASSAKTAVNEALTLYLIRATHQMLRALIHHLHFCNSVLYFKGISPPITPARAARGVARSGRRVANWSVYGLFL